jgi:hypothetical protein
MKKLLRFMLRVPGTVRNFYFNGMSIARMLRHFRNDDFMPL